MLLQSVKNLSSEGTGVGEFYAVISVLQGCLHLFLQHSQVLTILPPVYLSDAFLKVPEDEILFCFHGKTSSKPSVCSSLKQSFI